MVAPIKAARTTGLDSGLGSGVKGYVRLVMPAFAGTVVSSGT